MADSTLETGSAESVVAADGEASPDEQVDAERSDEAEAARDPHSSEEALPSAGALLREAREARGLSQADLARTLNLQVRIVEALERDDDSQLPGPAFVRGYLRSYARLMGMDPEPLLVEHQARTGGVVPEVHASPRLEREDAQLGSARSRSRLIVVAAVLALALLVLIGLLLQRPEFLDSMLSSTAEPGTSASGRSQGPRPSVERPAAPAALIDEARDGRSVAIARVRLASGPETSPGTAMPATGVPAANTGSGAAASATTAVEADRGPAAVEGDALEEANAGSTRDADLVPDGGQGAAEPPTVAPAVEAGNAIGSDAAAEAGSDGIVRIRSVDGRNLRVLAGGEEHLQFAFEGECWVHVRDADGRSIYQDLNRSGEAVELWGQAPFRIRLGYAPAVTLIYNGSRVALRPFTRNDVANLTLGR